MEPNVQTFYLGMMRTEGAGYLAAAIAISFLLAIPFRRREIWSTWAIVAIGVAEHLPTFFANLHVARTTAASPPWFFVLLCMLSLLLGLILMLVERSRKDSPSDLREKP